MRSLHVRRLQPFSLARILGAVYAVLGILFGAGAVVLVPLVYGTFGFIAGLLIGFLYNLVAGWLGGIEIEVEEIER